MHPELAGENPSDISVCVLVQQMRVYFEGEGGVFVFRPISKVLGKDKPKMNKIVFSERRKLCAMFEKWAVENNVADTPLGLIGYLSTFGLLDIERVKEHIIGEEE